MPQRTFGVVVRSVALLALAGTAPAARAQLMVQATVEAAQTGEPIPKYIYGQFIEHLGRCIYGGIWAEMLEDRKFYFAVTDDYNPYRSLNDQPFPVVGASPWQVTGAAGTVTMVEKDAFVGRHTPRVAAGSGLRQKDLGLVKGKGYAGYAWLRAPEGRAEVTVSLKGAAGAQKLGRVGSDYRKYEFRFTAAESTDHGELELAVAGAPCLVGTVSLMPSDNIRGMRADTLQRLKELDAPIYRWPGGNFTSGYEWRDGIGDRDRRPPRKNPAWTGVEHNDFGTDEFLAFCRELGTDPLIVVNTGFGDPYSAGQWVEYVNGAAATPMGALRRANGNARPYGVGWWGIGNEMYGPWQLGATQLKYYTLKHNRTVERMRAADPTIRTVGVGALGWLNAKNDPAEKRDWSAAMLAECAESMNWISEHFYCHEKADTVEHARQIPDDIRKKAEGHRLLRQQLPNLAGKDIRISMDEWNYWYGPHPYGELGTRYFMKDALGIAEGLHEYYRNTDIIAAAFYAQTVNVIGCIKTTKTEAFFDATGLPLALYRRHFGTVPVKVAGDTKELDLTAAWSADGKSLTVGVVNPLAQPASVALEVKGAKLGAAGRVWTIAGAEPLSFNDAAHPGVLAVVEKPATSGAALAVAPLSINLFEFPAAK